MTLPTLVEQVLTVPETDARKRFLREHAHALDSGIAGALKDEAGRLLRADVQRSLDVVDLIYQVAELTGDPTDRALGLLAEANARSIGLAEYEQAMADDLARSEELRNDTIALYVRIYRDYPNFEDNDRVLFYLGVNLFELGKKKKAIDIYKRLIKEYPDSQYVPNVLFAFGEYYFENDDVKSALKAYSKVRKEYPDSDVYPYAMYKEAWCYYNMSKYAKRSGIAGLF